MRPPEYTRTHRASPNPVFCAQMLNARHASILLWYEVAWIHFTRTTGKDSQSSNVVLRKYSWTPEKFISPASIHPFGRPTARFMIFHFSHKGTICAYSTTMTRSRCALYAAQAESVLFASVFVIYSKTALLNYSPAPRQTSIQCRFRRVIVIIVMLSPPRSLLSKFKIIAFICPEYLPAVAYVCYFVETFVAIKNNNAPKNQRTTNGIRCVAFRLLFLPCYVQCFRFRLTPEYAFVLPWLRVPSSNHDMLVDFVVSTIISNVKTVNAYMYVVAWLRCIYFCSWLLLPVQKLEHINLKLRRNGYILQNTEFRIDKRNCIIELCSVKSERCCAVMEWVDTWYMPTSEWVEFDLKYRASGNLLCTHASRRYRNMR